MRSCDRISVSVFFMGLSLFFPFISHSGDTVTLSVSDGAGVRGSVCCNPLYPESNRVELSLTNSVNVTRLYADICNSELGSDLLFNDYALTSRVSGFSYTVTDLGGCIRVRFYLTPGVYIAPGTGPVAILYFDVAELATGGSCTDFTFSQVWAVSGDQNLTVDPELGEFCFYNCGVNQHCNDGVFCNGEEWCFVGVCQPAYADPCLPLLCNETTDKCYCNAAGQCDDGLYCNGAEQCSAGKCRVGAGPCSSDGDSCTSDCNEDTNSCGHVCTAVGPWDSCCQSSSACTGLTQCTPEVWVTVGDGTGAPGSTNKQVSVSLKNPADKVQGMQVKICDEGGYLSFDNLLSDCQACPVGGRCIGTGWGCNLIDEGDECWTMMLYTQSPTAYINYGTGAIATLKYDVSSQAPWGQCRELAVDTSKFAVVDMSQNALVAKPDDGQFCFPCTLSPACNDGNDCTTESCVNSMCVYSKRTSGSCNDYQACTVSDHCIVGGICVGDDKCPDDSAYCNGLEYCVSGSCSATGNPCVGLSCNEGGDVCSASEVTVEVLNAYGREGEIGIALENVSDEVSEVQVEVCDIDQRGWLTLLADECTTSSRSAGFYCVPTDLGGGCVRVHLWSTFGLDVIQPGSGVIARVPYTVDPLVTLLNSIYADIVPKNNVVKDTADVSLSVTPVSGRLYAAEYCEGDFNCDTDVDAGDVTLFLADFGRSIYYRPCSNPDPCNGDFNCDKDVDAGDMTVFLQDYGRSLWSDPCPPCATQFDCVY